MFNPQWNKDSFSYSEQERTLILKGSGLETLTVNGKYFNLEKGLKRHHLLSLIKSLPCKSST